MSKARFSHSAVTLANGNILMVGGVGATGTLAPAELYSQSTGHFTVTGSLYQSRADAAVMILKDGRVLVAAGFSYCAGYPGTPCIDTAQATAEIYTPSTGKFTKTVSMAHARGAASIPLAAIQLGDGRILIEGGSLHNGTTLDSAELYDFVTGKFVGAGSLKYSRGGNTATKLLNGKVLIAGGLAGGGGIRGSAELYVP